MFKFKFNSRNSGDFSEQFKNLNKKKEITQKESILPSNEIEKEMDNYSKLTLFPNPTNWKEYTEVKISVDEYKEGENLFTTDNTKKLNK